MNRFSKYLVAFALSVLVGFGVGTWYHWPQSKFEIRNSKIAPAPPAPAFTPDPNVVAFINGGNPFVNPTAPTPWLEAKSSDPNVPPGAAPATTFIMSRVEPVVTRDGNEWKITFKTPP